MVKTTVVQPRTLTRKRGGERVATTDSKKIRRGSPDRRARSSKEAEFATFKKWLRATGFEWDDADLDLRASGTISAGGVFAKRDIAVGKNVVKIPKQSCITWRTSSLVDAFEKAARDTNDWKKDDRRRKPRGGAAAGEAKTAAHGRGAGLMTDHVPANVKLILCLTHELHLGQLSHFSPYLATVPEYEAGVPLLWPEVEACELLRGTELDEHCQFKRLEIASEYYTHVEPLTRHLPALFPLATYSLAQYTNKATLVSSRSFTIDSYHGPGMVPFADLFNHQTDGEHLHFTGREEEGEESESGGGEEEDDAEEKDNEEEMRIGKGGGGGGGGGGEKGSTASRSESENDSESECGKDEMVMECVLPIKKGEEVFNTYGPIGSAPLLVRYGYCKYMSMCVSV